MNTLDNLTITFSILGTVLIGFGLVWSLLGQVRSVPLAVIPVGAVLVFAAIFVYFTRSETV